MAINPDPKKYIVRYRRGKILLVDKQILRWRRERKKAEAKATPKMPYNAPGCPTIEFQDKAKGVAAPKAVEALKNLFGDSDD